MTMMPRKNERLTYERKLWGQKFKRVMGLDEVGRGCLSGPVVAAGVILPPEFEGADFPDSKQIGREEREEMARQIKEVAIYTVIRQVSPAEIDRLNILHASIKAMLNCVESGGNPDFLLVDGNRFTSCLTPFECIVKGDQKSASIGAASILAKTYRDELMRELHNEYPWYDWRQNVGYPTRKHYEGLESYGYSPYHRLSFNLRTDRAINREG